MVQMENLDIRTVTMGINLRDCADSDFEQMNRRVYEKITTYAKDLKTVAEKVEKEYGIPIINKRISITPIAEILGHATKEQAVELAKTLDKAAVTLGVDFIGGFSALINKGISKGDQVLLDALPEALTLRNGFVLPCLLEQLDLELIWMPLNKWVSLSNKQQKIQKIKMESPVLSLLFFVILLKIILLWLVPFMELEKVKLY